MAKYTEIIGIDTNTEIYICDDYADYFSSIRRKKKIAEKSRELCETNMDKYLLIAGILQFFVDFTPVCLHFSPCVDIQFCERYNFCKSTAQRLMSTNAAVD